MTTTVDTEALEAPGISTLHAGVMFYASLVYLAIMAVVIQWWNTSVIEDADSDFTARLMLVIWAPFILEALLGLIIYRHHGNNIRRFLLIALVPAFRLSFSTFHHARLIWLPVLGWQAKSDELFKRLTDLAILPMLIIALMILPVFGAEFMLKDKVYEVPWLLYTLNGSTAFIWFAFAMEFILMVSVAEKKLDYCKRNWLNLIIILLPLIAFLRGFQLVRVFRVAKAGKLLRVYRMRSLGIRVYQTLIALSAIERLIHRDPNRHMEKLKEQHDEAEQELKRIKDKMIEVQQRIDEQNA